MEENITSTPAQLPDPEKSISLTQEAQFYLTTAAKWGTFLAIIGFVGCAMLILTGVWFGFLFASIALVPAAFFAAGLGTMLGLVYVAFGVLCFFPSLYLYQFSSYAKKGVVFQNANHVTLAISKLKSCLKFWGIIMIVFLSLTALELIAFFALLGGNHSSYFH